MDLKKIPKWSSLETRQMLTKLALPAERSNRTGSQMEKSKSRPANEKKSTSIVEQSRISTSRTPSRRIVELSKPKMQDYIVWGNDRFCCQRINFSFEAATSFPSSGYGPFWTELLYAAKEEISYKDAIKDSSASSLISPNVKSLYAAEAVQNYKHGLVIHRTFMK
ncbi:unnamed protein product [Acanthoscelides obtectus]|uniref:Uncharacterized protein n=1 Tax=Acanthoscelides obtectus TaxID=200917 RepID=A0A9P0Q983_ACAOB|nr:unnamed protein product [Acanthoscelides obtectus]CAK1675883.1 hypothetical protein AOBTE_LOCUS30464 [Acanthoscelides obtectus]